MGPVTYGERTLWLSYRMPVQTGDRMLVTFEKYVKLPRQALQVSAPGKRDRLRVNGQEGRRFVFWTSTAPPEVAIEVVKAAKGAEIVFSNAWEAGGPGTMLYGLNWTAIDVIPVPDGSVRLDCSDGFGREPSFGDLVVRVRREAAAASEPVAGADAPRRSAWR